MPRLLALILAAAVLHGCAFMRDRGRDLAQVMDASVGYSEGLAVNLRATKVLQVGFGAYRGVYWTGLKDGAVDTWQEERSELGIGPLYLHEVFRSRGSCLLDIRHPLFGEPGFREHSWDVTHLTDRGWFDLGATLNLVLVGFDLAFKPAELVDLAAGFAGCDLLQDDVGIPSLEVLLQRVHSDDARVRAAAVRALRARTGETFDYVIYTAPKQMPADQIRALQRWRDKARELGTVTAPPAAADPAATGAAPEASP